MGVGCTSYCFRDMEWLQALEAIRATGLRSVELWCGHPGRALQQERDGAVREAAGRLGLTLAAAGLGNLTGDETAETLEPSFRLAHGWQVPVVTVAAAPRQFDALEELAERFAVRVAVENRYRAAAPWGDAFESPVTMARLLAGRGPRLGANLDTGHCLAAGFDPAAAVELLGNRLFHVHLKDVAPAAASADAPTDGRADRRPDAMPVTVEPGTGRLAIPAFFDALARVSYRGLVSIEYDGLEAAGPILRRAVERLGSLERR